NGASFSVASSYSSIVINSNSLGSAFQYDCSGKFTTTLCSHTSTTVPTSPLDTSPQLYSGVSPSGILRRTLSPTLHPSFDNPVSSLSSAASSVVFPPCVSPNDSNTSVIFARSSKEPSITVPSAAVILIIPLVFSLINNRFPLSYLRVKSPRSTSTIYRQSLPVKPNIPSVLDCGTYSNLPAIPR